MQPQLGLLVQLDFGKFLRQQRPDGLLVSQEHCPFFV